MRLQIVSDLHLEFTNRRTPMVIDNAGADVLILAGDICTASKFDQFLPFFEDVSKKFSFILYIVGNHEHYKYKFQSTCNTIDHHLSKNFKNIQLLEKNWWIHEKVLFWGGTLWTDCNQGDKETRQTLAKSLNDFRLIQYGEWDHLLPINIMDEFRDSISGLKHTLEITNHSDVSLDKHFNKVVVLTHHAPSFKSVPKKFKNDFHMNGGYASNLEQFILDHPEIKLWIHGHMHDSVDYQIGETRVICNPAGYPDWQGTENGWFERELVVEI